MICLFCACVTKTIHKDKSQCLEFVKQGILKQIPAKAIRISDIVGYRNIKMWFFRPVTTAVLPDAWESSCEVSEMFAFPDIH
jgi:hypothetical protein